MEKTTASAALLALASNGEHRTKTGKLRELLPEIEAAQAAGNTNKVIVETLNAQGFEITLKSFPTMLHRARKGLKKLGAPSFKKEQNQPSAGRNKSADKELVEAGNKPPVVDRVLKPVGKTTPPTQEELKNITRSQIDLADYES